MHETSAHSPIKPMVLPRTKSPLSDPISIYSTTSSLELTQNDSYNQFILIHRGAAVEVKSASFVFLGGEVGTDMIKDLMEVTKKWKTN
jgi:hypothetical protein